MCLLSEAFNEFSNIHPHYILLYITGDLRVGISLVVIDYNKGNHNLARERTIATERVGQHLTKCMDYHQIKTNNPN